MEQNHQNSKELTDKSAKLEEVKKQLEENDSKLAELKVKMESEQLKAAGGASSNDLNPVSGVIKAMQTKIDMTQQRVIDIEKQVTKIAATVENMEKYLMGAVKPEIEELRRQNEEIMAGFGYQQEQNWSFTILLFGKERKMFILNLDRSQWIPLPLQLPEDSLDCGAACLNDEIYVFGGFGLDKKTYKLNQNMQWIQLTDLNEARWNISNSSLVFEGCLWTFGGYNSSGYLKTVERYSLEENKWEQMPPMNENRSCTAAAACHGKLFVCGGYNGKEWLKSTECLDPKTGLWSLFVDLPSPRSDHALISDGSSLILIGGKAGQGKSATAVWVVILSEEEPKWNEVQNMIEGRSYLTVASLGNEVFAIGGEKKKSVEVFNQGRWEYGPELPENSWRTPSVVISPQLVAAFFNNHCNY